MLIESKADLSGHIVFDDSLMHTLSDLDSINLVN